MAVQTVSRKTQQEVEKLVERVLVERNVPRSKLNQVALEYAERHGYVMCDIRNLVYLTEEGRAFYNREPYQPARVKVIEKRRTTPRPDVTQRSDYMRIKQLLVNGPLTIGQLASSYPQDRHFISKRITRLIAESQVKRRIPFAAILNGAKPIALYSLTEHI
jgi:hypothetical protein